MAAIRNILKSGETLYFGAGTNFGVNQNVVFRSSKPYLATVNNNGLVSVIAEPTDLEHVVITAEDEYGIPLGSRIVYVVPNSYNKATLFKVAQSSLSEKYLKQGETSQFTVDAGSGSHVGVMYSTSTTNLITVNSSGLISCVQALNVPKQVMVYAKDSQGFLLHSAAIFVIPASVDKTKLTVKPSIVVSIDAGS